MISVIIPLYNKEKAIQNTLLSVLKQTYQNFEIIVVDDGGTDNSANIVKKIAQIDNRINYFYKHNGGVSSARNYGLSKAKGEWIIFLDADDEMLPNNLEHLNNLVQTHKVNIAAGNVMINYGSHTKTNHLNCHKPETVYKNIIPALIGHEAIFPNGAVLFKRLILKKNPYNENLCRYEDAEFELKLFKDNVIVFSTLPIHIIHSEFAELSKVQSNKKEKDYIYNLNFKGMSFWQRIYLGRFIREGCFSYANGFKTMKSLYGTNYYWQYIYILVRKFYTLKHKILSFLNKE